MNQFSPPRHEDTKEYCGFGAVKTQSAPRNSMGSLPCHDRPGCVRPGLGVLTNGPSDLGVLAVRQVIPQ